MAESTLLAVRSSLAPLGLPHVWLAVGFGPVGIMEGPYAAKMLVGRIAKAVESETDRAVMASIDPSRPGCCELNT